MCFLRNSAAALPAHDSELCGADVVQEDLQTDVAVPHEVNKVLVLGNELGHLGKDNDKDKDNGANAMPAGT